MLLSLKRVRGYITKVLPTHSATLFVLAVLVGLSTGASVFVFRRGVGFFAQILRGEIDDHILGDWLRYHSLPVGLGVILSLTAIGYLVGLLQQHLVGEDRFRGVAGVMAAVAMTGGRIRTLRMPVKALGAMLSLGGGASLGAEDPSVQIGSNIGSFLGQRIGLDDEQLRLLVGAGAASATAAAFNAPIAGVFFALEVILGEFSTRSFGVVVLASVISAGFTQAVNGQRALFEGMNVEFGSPDRLIWYLLLGVLLAFVASAYLRIFYWTEKSWRERLRLSPPVKTALTGALLGIVGLALPQILGPGEDFMRAVLVGEASLEMELFIILSVVKLFTTAISVGGGFFGGVFAPTLFMGIMLGNGYGLLAERLGAGAWAGPPEIYAIAGMAGMMAGVIRAPITAVMLIFEVTGDYAFILPIMLTSVVCLFIIEQIGPVGIYQLALERQGVHISYGRDIDLMQGVTVSEAMQRAPSIRHDADLSALRHAFNQQHTRALCVLDDAGLLTGIVTLGDLQRGYEQAVGDDTIHLEELLVRDIATSDVITITPQSALWSAIRLMGAHNIGRLPVVDEPNGAKLVGFVRRHDIMDAYNDAIARKVRDQHFAEQVRLNRLTGANVLEYHISRRTPIAGEMLKDVRWPPETVVASIVRQGKLIVPHGNTKIEIGDVVTVVADNQSELLLDQLFGRRSRHALT